MTYAISAAFATVLAGTHSPTDRCPYERRLLFNTKGCSGIPRSSFFGKLKRKAANMIQKCGPSSPQTRTWPSRTRRASIPRRCSVVSISGDWVGESPASSAGELVEASPGSEHAREEVPTHGLGAPPKGAGEEVYERSSTENKKRRSFSRATPSKGEDESFHLVRFARPRAPKVPWEPKILVGPPVMEVETDFWAEKKGGERRERKTFTDSWGSESEEEEESDSEGEDTRDVRNSQKKRRSIAAEIKQAMRETWTKAEELGA
ncbi:hypothetical protein BU16DRAFT_579263 [Lophium mytilinum]|uniref:Uncharacterized protein n=1 Tax=Lophium mytilinum TaxID=390894 RepID=A0A6A6R5Z5_9PEZI|nr:hypothetical protein BU16DRAFT_579263 [Lophium mytilinum]